MKIMVPNNDAPIPIILIFQAIHYPTSSHNKLNDRSNGKTFESTERSRLGFWVKMHVIG
jgi:hypothetical protein